MSHERGPREKTIEPAGLTLVAPATGAMPSEELRSVADGAEDNLRAVARSDQSTTSAPLILRVGNQGERAQAAHLVSQITGYRDHLGVGIKDGLIAPGALATNTDAVLRLEDFSTSAGEQARTLNDFQAAYRTIQVDVARLNAQLALVKTQNPGLDGNVIDAWGGEAALRRRSTEVATTAGGGAHWEGMQQQHQLLEAKVTQAASAQSHVVSAKGRIVKALAEIEAGVPAHEKVEPEKNDILKATSTIKSGLEKLIEGGFKAAKLPGASVAKAVPGVVLDDLFAESVRDLEARTAEGTIVAKHGDARKPVAGLRVAVAELAAAMISLEGARREIATAREGLRDSSRQFASSAEATGAADVGTIAELYAETDALQQQISLALELGRAEAAASGNAQADLRRIQGGASIPYYEPTRTYNNRTVSTLNPSTVGISYDAVVRHVLIGQEGLGGTQGGRGVDLNVSVAMAQLIAMQTVVAASRDRLAGALGFSHTARREEG